jgi:hypothetical protein
MRKSTFVEVLGSALGEIVGTILVGALVSACDEYINRHQFLEDGLVV